GRAHIVVDAPPRHAAQYAEGVVVGVEQHLVGLLGIGVENEGAAVGELEVSDLQFGPLAADDRPIFRPVELKRLAWAKTPAARTRRDSQSRSRSSPGALRQPCPDRRSFSRR